MLKLKIITFLLLYPEGSSQSDEFSIIHLEGGNNPLVLVEGRDYTKDEEGFLVTTESFSPFLVSWKSGGEEDMTEESEDAGKKSLEETAEGPPEAPKEAEQEKTGMSAGLVVVILLLLGAAGGAGYYVYLKKKDGAQP
ncbi:MAG: hypothetical protein K2O16_15305 [Lachnospiraceae bacterium]|nr:hypothetical protein [Lachnospiraceae bacterium]